MTLQAVLFDLDGTLLDTAPDFVTTVNILRHEERLPELDEQVIRRTVSNGARALVGIAFEVERDHPDFSRLLDRLLAIYEQHLSVKTRPFPGIDETLALLKDKGIPWGIVTNKSITYTQPIIDALQFDPAPATVICPDHVSRTKPDPEPLLLACREIGCAPEDTIYIGDHLRDIDCGRNAGSVTVAAAYGYIDGSEDILDWKADHLVHSATELPALISSYL